MLAAILPALKATLDLLWYASTMSLAQLWSRVWYFPGIVHNSVVVALSFGKYRWFNRIDDTVILGALPFRSQTEEVRVIGARADCVPAASGCWGEGWEPSL